MIKHPSSDSELARDLLTLSRTPEGQALVEWLTNTRGQVMELMTQVSDEVRLRQFQGASVALKDIIDSINRIP